MDKNIRVRFAPSPTGYLHVGGLRTALYNYLFARKQKGKFILRIEDTDRNRYVEGAVENLITSLNWCGLDYDEGPDKVGPFGPYIQSQRLGLYQKHAESLVSEGKAYYCFCTTERLDALREEQQKQKLPQAKYDKHCLHLNEDEIKNNLENGITKVIRLNVEPDKKVVFEDIVRGTVEFNSNNIDDQILIKSDGYPTYHLANVVDDHLMEISHVIRGEEWLSSTPKHILLYDYFGWNKPVFAHLPLLLNPDRSKLSKRQGDVAVEDYKQKGYLSEALVNFVALLGWNAGDDREFYSMDELIEQFTLERINKSGAVFDIEKLNWLNTGHLRSKSNIEILPMLKEELSSSEFNIEDFSDEYLLSIIEIMKERVSFAREFITKSLYFFKPPTEYDAGALSKNWKPETSVFMKKLYDAFYSLNEKPSKEDYEEALSNVSEELKIGKGKLIHPLRLSVSGTNTGPGMYDLLFILGKHEVLSRMQRALTEIK